jgi:hypothetical protein
VSVILAVVCVSTYLADEAPAVEPTYTIREKIEVGTQVHTRLQLVIRGKVRVADDKTASLAGQALLEYPERVLEIGPDGTARKVVRFYQDARAKFAMEGGEDARQLQPQTRLIVGEREEQSMVLWSPAGPLVGDERELIEDVLDASRLPGLLPAEPVAMGATWAPDPGAVQAVCDFDHFIESNLKGRLASADKGKATIVIEGTAQGLSAGAEVKSEVHATLTVNLTSGLAEQIVWEQKDSRGPSPISPPGDYDVRIVITRSKTDSPQLSEKTLAGLSLTADPTSKLLVFEGPGGAYRFLYDRNWHVTAVQRDIVILRRMEGTEFVAQLNVTVLPDRKAGTVMNPEEFQATIEKTKVWNISQIVRADAIPTNQDFNLQMVSAYGQQGELRMLQKHYLVTTARGKQLVLSFVAEPANEEKVSAVDLSLVQTVAFPKQ